MFISSFSDLINRFRSIGKVPVVQDQQEESSSNLSVIEQAKDICVNKLLIPFEGEGSKTKDGKFKAYKDPGSKSGLPITIAWGLTYHADGTPVQLGEEWTKEYALEVKGIVLNKFIKAVIELCPCLATEHPNKLAAVTSFAYNVGTNNLKISNLRKRINAKDWNACPLEFNKWTMASGRKMKGLVRRRKAEGDLFMLED